MIHQQHNHGLGRVFRGVLPKSLASLKVGRGVATAPSEVTQFRMFRVTSNASGAVGTPRPATRQVGQRALGAALLLILATRPAAAEQVTIESARAAAARGNAQALYFLGKCYAKGNGVPQNYTNAAECLQKAAERGCAPAQNDLGASYAKGLGVKQDYAKAARWYRKAAEKGDELAQYSLGRAYWLGRGVATNTQASLQWLNRAAKRNQPDAMQFLGEIYLNGGPGLKAEGRRAFHWFLEAASQGSAGALYSLGQLFEAGNGVPRNRGLAINCYLQAAEKGGAQAMMRLSELYMLRIPAKADTCSNSKRTLIPFDIGQLSERSDALGLVINKCPI